MKVRDAMHKGATWVEPTTPVREVAKRMRESDIGAIPVKAEGHLVGIVTDRDIACRAIGNGGDIRKMTAQDVMSKHVACCSPENDIGVAIQVMEERRVRRLPVTDSHNAIISILSLGDISHMVGKDKFGEVLRAVSEHHI